MIRAVGDEHFGTGFTLDVDARQYLITAKHVVASLSSEGAIEIHKLGDHWDLINIKIFRCDDPIDIAILVPPSQLTPALRLEPSSASFFFGQDVYFVGFPYGLSMNVARDVNYGFPIAFMKKGIISAAAAVNGGRIIFLDGHNNPGFSGGPIVHRDLNQSDVVFKLLGVVSGFRPETTPVLKPEKIEPSAVTSPKFLLSMDASN